ncbi:MAG TPA: hypothetical protein VFN67_30025 [Polyangiales bacterium]|jgi:hypothetical protein|nr:hypothetical protein [Polyangiales bacterium]
MPTRAHVGWGLLISLTLHVSGIAALSLALPRLNVRPGMVRQVEFAVLEAPSETGLAAATAPPPLTASADLEPAALPLAAASDVAAPQTSGTKAQPRAAARVRKPLTATASPRQVTSATHADPRSDGSALQRVLTQIAATTELTPDERRKAMLVVLRTWEDPSGTHSAEQLIDALLEDARKARAAPR